MHQTQPVKQPVNQPLNLDGNLSVIHIKKFIPFPDLNKYRNDPAFDYREKPPEMSFVDRVLAWIYRTFMHTTYNTVSNVWTWRIIQGICLLLLLFILYKIFKLEKLGLFKKKVKHINQTFAGDETDFLKADFKAAIRQAIINGDFRNAVRLWYLQTLRDLSDRQIINWSIEKTNNVYLNEMRSSSFYNSFARLTYAFEYTFYGRFDIPEETYKGIEADFEKFVSDVKR